MKGSRLVDVLDEKELGNDKVVGKMNILLATIEAANPSIDHFDLRWVEHKLEEFKGGVVPIFVKNIGIACHIICNKDQNRKSNKLLFKRG